MRGYQNPPTHCPTAIQLEFVVQIHRLTTSSIKCNCGASTVFNAVWNMSAGSCTTGHVTIFVRERTAPIFCTVRRTMGTCRRTTTSMSPSSSENCTCKTSTLVCTCLKDHKHVSAHNDGHATHVAKELDLWGTPRFLHSLHCGYRTLKHNKNVHHADDEQILRHSNGQECLSLLPTRNVHHSVDEGSLRHLPSSQFALWATVSVTKEEGVSMICSKTLKNLSWEKTLQTSPLRHLPATSSCPRTHCWGSWAPPCT